MQTARVHQFGGVENIVIENTPRPAPGIGQVLVEVKAAGVGPWDALVRSGASSLRQALPLTPGSDLAGIVAAVGSDVSGLQIGDNVFGVTNPQFTGAYAEYAVADAGMIAPKPASLSYVEAASVPVVAITAWQMVFDKGQVEAGKRVLVLGAGGGVGAYAVQFAKQAGAEVIGLARTRDANYVRSLGANPMIDAHTSRCAEQVKGVDVVIDTIGGEILDQSFDVLKPGGIVVSVVSLPDQEKAAQKRVRGAYFIVCVTSAGLSRIAGMFDAGQLTTHVGETLPLAKARLAHEMLAGKPHKPGKIVLTVSA